jgi:Tol biopolymer transport system component
VTLDGVGGAAGAAAISPDGRWVAYMDCCATRRLRVVPSTGGSARTLVEPFQPAGVVVSIAWSPDGRSVLYTLPDPERAGARLMAVPLDGGAAVEVDRAAEGFGRLSPDGRLGAQVINYGQANRQRELRIRGRSGALLKRVALPDGFIGAVGSWSADGRTYVGPASDQRAVIRLAATSGGSTRALSAGAEYDWPDAWSADSRTFYYSTSVDGKPTFASARIDGSAGPQLAMPQGGGAGSWSTIAGRWAIGQVRWLDSARHQVVARNLDDGRTLTLVESPTAIASVRGPGGTYGVDGDAYVYLARAGDRVEVRSIVPGGRSRVLHAAPASAFGTTGVGVHDGRVAYTEVVGDSVRLMLVAGDGSAPRRLATVRASRAAGEVAWTRDGRHLAFGTDDGSVLHVLSLARGGTPTAPPRRVELPFQYAYELSFLPDGRRIAMIAQPRGGPNAVAAVVALDDPTRPVILSQDDGTSTWGLMLSPDGQWVAYAAELPPRGTTVYRIDLGDMARSARR